MSECILAIESSCDDTSAAIITGGALKSNIVASQLQHQEYGGVVPELASRAHMQKIISVVEEALKVANCHKKDLDAIACTRGPGLMGSLMVGLSFAKGLALSLDIPLIEVHHMQAHIMAHFIDDPKPDFPFLCLTVSGGHTQIVLVNSPFDMKILGETLDDAAGEAFDKIGKLMGLPYPAGPHIDQLAQKGVARYAFPQANVEDDQFSFSGLKTAVRYFLMDQLKKDAQFIENNLHDLAASVQSTIIQTLIHKVKYAANRENIHQVAIAGGVSANSGLRKALALEAASENWKLFIPDFQYCTDNAGMIAQTAHYLYRKKRFAPLSIKPMARLPMTNLTS
jgi:N6-L-threonylcarbamoyladenine synthase